MMKTGERGLICVLSGEGKGKTCAAVGMAVRARAYGKKVCFVSFHKNPGKSLYGEYACMKTLGIDLFFFAGRHPACRMSRGKCSKKTLTAQCEKGRKFLQELFKADEYEMIVIDEILICVRDGFLSEKQVVELMEKKPGKTYLVLTGRGLTRKIKKKADLVSEIKEVKHPFKQGLCARRGIDF